MNRKTSEYVEFAASSYGAFAAGDTAILQSKQENQGYHVLALPGR
jgi:hypothetical protein